MGTAAFFLRFLFFTIKPLITPHTPVKLNANV